MSTYSGSIHGELQARSRSRRYRSSGSLRAWTPVPPDSEGAVDDTAYCCAVGWVGWVGWGRLVAEVV